MNIKWECAGQLFQREAAGFTNLPTQTDFSDISVADRGILQGDLNGLASRKKHKRFNLNSLSENITNLLQHHPTKCGVFLLPGHKVAISAGYTSWTM